jgi:hypothetical protein
VQLTPHRGRTVDPARRVKVYRNLHKQCYSVMQDHLVVAHTQSLHLVDVTFLVNARGRDRVRKSGVKNVHAFVEGMLATYDHPIFDQVPNYTYYNPRTTNGFMAFGYVLATAKGVSLENSGVYSFAPVVTQGQGYYRDRSIEDTVEV